MLIPVVHNRSISLGTVWPPTALPIMFALLLIVNAHLVIVSASLRLHTTNHSGHKCASAHCAISLGSLRYSVEPGTLVLFAFRTAGDVFRGAAQSMEAHVRSFATMCAHLTPCACICVHLCVFVLGCPHVPARILHPDAHFFTCMSLMQRSFDLLCMPLRPFLPCRPGKPYIS